MIVSKRVTNGWKLSLEHGDFTEIERVYNINARQASRAIKTGRMANKTFFSIQDYFNKKKRG